MNQKLLVIVLLFCTACKAMNKIPHYFWTPKHFNWQLIKKVFLDHKSKEYAQNTIVKDIFYNNENNLQLLVDYDVLDNRPETYSLLQLLLLNCPDCYIITGNQQIISKKETISLTVNGNCMKRTKKKLTVEPVKNDQKKIYGRYNHSAGGKSPEEYSHIKNLYRKEEHSIDYVFYHEYSLSVGFEKNKYEWQTDNLFLTSYERRQSNWYLYKTTYINSFTPPRMEALMSLHFLNNIKIDHIFFNKDTSFLFVISGKTIYKLSFSITDYYIFSNYCDLNFIYQNNNISG